LELDLKVKNNIETIKHLLENDKIQLVEFKNHRDNTEKHLLDNYNEPNEYKHIQETLNVNIDQEKRNLHFISKMQFLLSTSLFTNKTNNKRKHENIFKNNKFSKSTNTESSPTNSFFSEFFFEN
jgi:hypothetical protein